MHIVVLACARYKEGYFNSFRKCTYTLTRQQASLMIQLRCGHVPLNSYLFKIGKAETEICQNCHNDENGTRRKETVNHFLFECTAFEQEREEILEKINRSHLNLRDIMIDTDRMHALALYVSRTGRFKKP
jgi:hypothetical protein